MYGTMQTPEKIVYKGKMYHFEALNMFDKPLESFFKNKKRPNFMPRAKYFSTANRRGYVCTWEVKDGFLYLKKIITYINGKRKYLYDIFGKAVNKHGVKFIWYTGVIRFKNKDKLYIVKFKKGKLVKLVKK